MLIERRELMINHTLLETPAERPATVDAETPRRSLALIILSGLWLILFFAALFAPPLLDDADGTHASAARHMALTGDLVTLRVDGVRYLEKSPLPYWLVALSFRIFGFNTFAAHLPQAIGVLLLALLGYRWTYRAFSPRAAFYTGLATLTSAGVFLFTRYFIPEVLLSLFLCTSLYCLLRALSPSNKKSVILSEGGASAAQAEGSAVTLPATNPGAPYLDSEMWAFTPRANRFASLYPYIMWTALALAVLTKGLVALVFFFGTAIVYLALTNDYKNWRRLKPITGTLLFLAIAAPWHILAGLRNTGGMDGHGFFWFYFVNEHFLRFLGRRYPMDYNKLPSYLYWTLHLVWLFPWSLFCGTVILQAYRAFQRYTEANPILEDQTLFWQPFAVVIVGLALRETVHLPYFFTVFIALVLFLLQALRRRQRNSSTPEPLLRATDFRQRTTLLLSLFATLVLVFFSLSTNQEYYTFPAYLPLLILIAAALIRSEQSFSTDKSARLWITVAHATFTILGIAVALTLAYGLWTSRNIPFVPDIGDLLAHRGVGDYTLSMSALFDLTGPSFAALRLPAALAALAFLIGPAAAWLLRIKEKPSRLYDNHRPYLGGLPHRRPHRLRPLRPNALLKRLRRNHPAAGSQPFHLQPGRSSPLRRSSLRLLNPLLPRPRRVPGRWPLHLHALRRNLSRRPTNLPHAARSREHLGQRRS